MLLCCALMEICVGFSFDTTASRRQMGQKSREQKRVEELTHEADQDEVN